MSDFLDFFRAEVLGRGEVGGVSAKQQVRRHRKGDSIGRAAAAAAADSSSSSSSSKRQHKETQIKQGDSERRYRQQMGRPTETAATEAAAAETAAIETAAVETAAIEILFVVS